MKRCPECQSLFPATEKFCELDGTALIDEPTQFIPDPPKRFPLAIVAMVGIIIGVLLALMYLVVTREKPQKSVASSSSPPAKAQQQLPPRPLAQQQPVPSPTTEPSPSPSVEPSPSVQPSPEQLKLSTDPISTARGQNGGPLTIKLNTGVTIEADEAWQTKEGIWYRKGGMVSLLDPKDIKSVEKKTVR